MIRFLHSSDLHLGKPFGRFPEDVRGRLRQARQDSIGKLAATARAGGASHILLAGDTFDAETPKPTVIRHALNAMAADPDLTWVLMPGNHDSLAASELWRVLTADLPDNVLLAKTTEPIKLGTAILLPAPCTVRHPGRDLTEWMDGADTGDAIRIGLAHGGVRDFGGSQNQPVDGGSAVIAPDRADRAGLDYLALGDWHGRIEVGSKTWYSGTPEADSFKPHRPAGALLVMIDGQGATPIVEEVETGSIRWKRATLDLLPEDDAVARHSDLLPELAMRKDTMLDFVARGRAALHDIVALESEVAASAPDFLWHGTDFTGVASVHDTSDLDLIAESGALRSAAATLAEESANSEDPVTRAAAASALARLFTYAMDEA